MISTKDLKMEVVRTKRYVLRLLEEGMSERLVENMGDIQRAKTESLIIKLSVLNFNTY